MPRKKNDGRGRLGGRAKGTPNKVSAELKDWLASILNNGKERFERDIEQLDASERVRVYMSLLNYVLPKQQSMTAEAVAEAEIKELESQRASLDEEINKYLKELGILED